MFIFAEEKRPKLQQERPDLSDSELTRFLARMWNELPDKKKVTIKLKSNQRLQKRCEAKTQKPSLVCMYNSILKC